MILPDPTDHDRFLTAATINLFLESLRRTSGRGLLVPGDIPTLFEMINILTSDRPAKPEPGPTREITAEERAAILQLNEILDDLPYVESESQEYTANVPGLTEAVVAARRH